jgi:hypothetical protein
VRDYHGALRCWGAPRQWPEVQGRWCPLTSEGILHSDLACRGGGGRGAAVPMLAARQSMVAALVGGAA